MPGKLTVEEAAGMFDVWAKDRALGDGELPFLSFVLFILVFR